MQRTKTHNGKITEEKKKRKHIRKHAQKAMESHKRSQSHNTVKTKKQTKKTEIVTADNAPNPVEHSQKYR